MKTLGFLCYLLFPLAVAAAEPRAATAETQAVESAEAFMARHGFTTADHPEDQPVEQVSLYDILSSPEKLVAQRKGSVEAHATCVRHHADSYTVLFRSLHNTQQYLFVHVSQGERSYVGHQSVSMSTDCKPVSGSVP